MPTPAEFDVLQSVGTASPLIPGGGSAGTNTTNLQQMLYQLLSSTGPTGGQGGTLLFPPDQFAFNGTVVIGVDSSGTSQPFPIILRCTGASQDNDAVLQFDSDLDFFQVNTLSANCLGGVVFQDLVFQFTGSQTPGNAAIRNQGSQNVRVFRCSFLNWPVSIALDNSLSFSMRDSQIYTIHDTSVGITLGQANGSASAIETYLGFVTFLGYDNGGQTAVQINGCEHLRMV